MGSKDRTNDSTNVFTVVVGYICNNLFRVNSLWWIIERWSLGSGEAYNTGNEIQRQNAVPQAL